MVVAELSKTTAHRLLQWRAYREQLRHEITHIPSEENCWSDLLSRWWRTGAKADGEMERSLGIRAAAIYPRADTDVILPSKNAIKASQLQVAPPNKQEEINLSISGR